MSRPGKTRPLLRAGIDAVIRGLVRILGDRWINVIIGLYALRLDGKQRRAVLREHPETDALGLLAERRRETGDLAGAVEVYERLLASQLRALGEDHYRTLTSRLKLAGLRGEAGDVAGAAAAHVLVFADMLRALGPHHPVLASAKWNLDHWRGKAEESR